MKRAFTLVELLIVVAIIGILASITLAALSQAQGQAKVYRTQTTIAKINDAIAEIYEQYEFSAGQCAFSTPPFCTTPTCIANNPKLAKPRAEYLLKRNAMRMEMPQCAADIDTTATPALDAWAATVVCSSPVHASIKAEIMAAATAACEAATIYQDATSGPWTSASHVADPAATESAELLYLIIETNNPEALAGFKGGEIGDTDGDGLFEFIDAWGNPIRFLRYAPGLQEGVLRVGVGTSTIETTRLGQPVIPVDELTNFATGSTPNPTIDAITNPAAIAFCDPLYPQQGTDPINPSVMPLGLVKLQWPTFPVIYSCGADKMAGIVETPTLVGGVADILPISASNILLGSPDNSGEHADNITNHNMVKPF